MQEYHVEFQGVILADTQEDADKVSELVVARGLSHLRVAELSVEVCVPKDHSLRAA